MQAGLITKLCLALALVIGGSSPAQAGLSHACSATHCIEASSGYEHLGCDADFCYIRAGLGVTGWSLTGYWIGQLTWDSAPGGTNGAIYASCSGYVLQCDGGQYGILVWRRDKNCHEFFVEVEASGGYVQPIYLVRTTMRDAFRACADGSIAYYNV